MADIQNAVNELNSLLGSNFNNNSELDYDRYHAILRIVKDSVNYNMTTGWWEVISK